MRQGKGSAGKPEGIRVGQQTGAADGGEVAAEQKVAVAALDVDGNPGVVCRPECAGDPEVDGIIVIVADPGLEKIAQNVDRLGLPGRAVEIVE